MFVSGCELRGNSSAERDAGPGGVRGGKFAERTDLAVCHFYITLSARRAIRAKIQEG